MRIDVPTEIIPLWFIEKWTKENAEPNSALDVFKKRAENLKERYVKEPDDGVWERRTDK